MSAETQRFIFGLSIKSRISMDECDLDMKPSHLPKDVKKNTLTFFC